MTASQPVIAIVVAAGTGSRAGGGADAPPKQYRRIGGKPVLLRTLEALLAAPEIDAIQPIIHPDHEALFAGLGLQSARLRSPVAGGASRQASVLAGLEAVAPARPAIVLVHDAARPFVSQDIISGVLAALGEQDGALPVIPVSDTIKRSVDGLVVGGTEDRGQLFAAQTPQGFRFAQLLAAHRMAAREPRDFTDDAAIAEWAGLGIAMTPGSPDNFKITRQEDFLRAELLLGGDMSMETRIGSGYDVHAFEPGSFVTLGGIEIPHIAGLSGHSDADVALHALTDAIYGALGEGDIGSFFPPSDPQWKGAASRIFLEHAAGLVRERGGRIVNLDVTLICEAPKIGPYVPEMRQTIGAICGLAPSRVAVKATTNEQLGFIGRREGIAAMATASVEMPKEQ